MTVSTISSPSASSTLTSTSATGSTSTANTTSIAQSLAATQASFYQLLLAQMEYQDPTNPMSNSQMTSQIAQMDTVAGINQLNASMLGSQALQSSSMLGKNVLVSGSSMQLSNGAAAYGINFPQGVDTANVTIQNSAGNTVATMALGAQTAGIQNFSWNGTTSTGQTAPAGAYTFSIQASQSGQPVTATTLSSGTVQSIATTANGLEVNLSSLGNVALSSIQEVY